MSDEITIDSSELRGLAESLRDLPELKAADALAEVFIRFKDRLRGSGAVPGDPWPIGTVKRSAKGNLYYTSPGAPGSRRSGRSLRGWKSKQKNLVLSVFNDARDPKTRSYYAEHVHLSGSASGTALDEAEEILFEEANKAIDEIAQLLAQSFEEA